MSHPPANRLFTLPNVLSLSRLPLGGLFWGALARGPGHALEPFAVLAAAGATDMLDGYVARRRFGTNPAGMGAWLDPFCDKLFVGSVLAALYFQRRAPLPLLVLVVARELLQLPMAVLYRASPTLRRWLRYDFRASVLGKAATIAQFLAVSALILDRRAAWPLAMLAFGLGLTALADYVRRAVIIGRRRAQAEEKRA
jgi:phosphatidylglycerophosphate synthase